MGVEVCSLCGVKLTIFNKAVGTSQCSGCHGGTSPAARRVALAQVFAERPELTEEQIRNRSVIAAVPWLLAGGILAEVIFFATLLLADELRIRGAIPVFVGVGVGYFAGGLVIAANKHVLDSARWGTFRNWLMGTVGLGSLVAVFLDGPLILVALLAGLLLGVLAVASSDPRRKEELVAKLRDHRAQAAAAMAAQGYPQQGYPQQGPWQQGAVQQGPWQQGALQQGPWQQGAVQQGAVQQGAVQQGAVQQGAWQQGASPQAYAQSGQATQPQDGHHSLTHAKEDPRRR